MILPIPLGDWRDSYKLRWKGLKMANRTLYIEPEITGLDRRLFFYDNNIIGSHISFYYLADYLANGSMARSYGFANKTMPDGVTIYGDLKHGK